MPRLRILATPIAFNEEKKIGSVLKRFKGVTVVDEVGAVPVFADADPEFLLIDLDSVKRAITKKTKAVIPVHLYGQPVAMDLLTKLCGEHDLSIIEDACQAHGAAINGKRCGSFGELGCFSFYPGKNLGAYGDGGMVTTDRPDLYEKILYLRNYGSVEKYVHLIPGFNARLDNLQAAFLNVKLPYLDGWNQKRISIGKRYFEHLHSISGITIPKEREGFASVFHLYVIRTGQREALQTFLKEKGVETSIHYPVPIHLQKAYENLPKKRWDLRVCEEEAKRVLSLPMYPEMTLDSVDEVNRQISEFFGHYCLAHK